MLAIAAPKFDTVSETFIRTHARTILPGRTVLVAAKPGGQGVDDLPIWMPQAGDQSIGTEAIVDRASSGLATFLLRQRGELDRSLAKHLTDNNVQAVMAEYLFIGARLVRAARLAGARLYVHAHGHDALVLSRRPQWRLTYLRLFEAAAGIFAPSRFVADRLAALGCSEEKLTVSPCGVDPARFCETSRRPGHVLTVGRFVEKKAPQRVVEAFAIASDLAPHARLTMIGDGPLLEQTRALVEKAGLSGRIRFLGACDHDAVRREMGQASVFVQHSVTAKNGDSEGLPVAILEAMASGMPIVSTCHSGIPEAVKSGEHGFLVAEHDSAAMGRRLAQLLRDPTKAGSMGARARLRALSDFTVDRAAIRLRAAMGFSEHQLPAPLERRLA